MSNYTRIWHAITEVYKKVKYMNGKMYQVFFLFKEQILLIDGDAFIQTPATTLQAIEKFLGLTPFFTPDHFVYKGTYLHFTQPYHCITL